LITIFDTIFGKKQGGGGTRIARAPPLIGGGGTKEKNKKNTAWWNPRRQLNFAPQSGGRKARRLALGRTADAAARGRGYGFNGRGRNFLSEKKPHDGFLPIRAFPPPGQTP